MVCVESVIIVCVVTVMLLNWSLFDSDCDDGVSAGIWVILTGDKSGGELRTLFDIDCDAGLSAGIWVIHTSPKSGSHKY